MTDTNGKGVSIAIASDVVIPGWLLKSKQVVISKEVEKGTPYTLLTIHGGHAKFRGWAVFVNLDEHERRYRLAFSDRLAVLEITSIKRERWQANRRLCFDCYKNTPNATPILLANGKYDVTYVCPCGNTWESHNIDWSFDIQPLPRAERRRASRSK